MRPKHSLDRLLTLKASGTHDLMGSITAQPAEEMRGERWDTRRAAQSRAFYPFVTAPAELHFERWQPEQTSAAEHIKLGFPISSEWFGGACRALESNLACPLECLAPIRPESSQMRHNIDTSERFCNPVGSKK
jgi:hypothetical protein